MNKYVSFMVLKNLRKYKFFMNVKTRIGSRTAATSKVELFVVIVNGWKPLTIITKSPTLDVAVVLDPNLVKTNL